MAKTGKSSEALRAIDVRGLSDEELEGLNEFADFS
jgi:hypothetical protein